MGSALIVIAIFLAVTMQKLHTVQASAVELAAKLDKIQPVKGHEHSAIRQWMIRQQLARVGPIVVLGDSLTEAAPLPASVCGHAVVNAGIGGANVTSMFDALPEILRGTSPALIVVALGTNDAHAAPNRVEIFREAYGKLLARAATIAPRLAVASIPAMDPEGALTKSAGMDAGLVDRFNVDLRELASGASATFIDVRKAIEDADLAAPTIDGVHLSPPAYDHWRSEIRAGIMKALECGTVAGAD